MNLFVVDPEWGWWIVLYFFLGGIAAGAYFVATLIDLFGREEDRELSRWGYKIAFPLVCLCGLFLIIDLHRPERFWHMLVKSELVKEAFHEGWPFSIHAWSVMVRAPLLKYWSPMSVGSVALSLFGLCSAVSFVATIWPTRWFGRILRQGIFARVFAVIGCLVGFFLAAYTGALLTATNQPIWSDSVWIAPLFLASAASTGLATMIVLVHWRGAASPESMNRLERADLWALALELAVFAIFLASLGEFAVAFWHTLGGKIFIVGTLIVGTLAPLAIHLRMGNVGRRAAVTAAALALVGGFFLRYGLLTAPPQLLRESAAITVGFGPEAGRVRGGGGGADPGNTTDGFNIRSKVDPKE
jgi:formate-dependent nitrite reductase membrane component NrfD